MEDPLMKEAQQHEYISEMISFFKRSYPLIHEKRDHAQMVALGKFFKEYIVDHFNYEETEIFPTLLAHGLPEEKKFVRSLQLEHVSILAEVDGFFLFLDKARVDALPSVFHALESSGQKIISRVLRHADREDKALFPMIRNYLS